MTREMKYQSVHNSYTVKKKGKPAYSSTGFLVCVILPLICGLLITASLFIRSTSFDSIVSSLSFNEIADVSYNVTIKEDENYGNNKTLPAGMKYVSSLLETVNPTFKYEFHSTDTLDIDYNYTIASKYVIYDYNDNTKKLTEDNIVNITTVTNHETNSSLNINEKVSVDFQEFSKKALDYKQDLRVAAIGKLYVYMTLNIKACSKDMDKCYERNNLVEELEIPLTDSLTDIKKNSNPINKQDFLTKTRPFSIINLPLFVITVLLFEVDIFLFIRLIREYKRYKNRDLYTSIVSKILKDYDRVIVRGKLDIDETKYTNIIYPETFEQLVDASVNEGSPILYYNVQPGQKCFFVIIEGDTLYKFRITRWYVDQNGHA